MTTLNPDGVNELLIKMLGGTVRLDGAACIGRHDLFDPRQPDEPIARARGRHERAAAMCEHCPALAACREWAATEPDRGQVIAGRQPNLTSPGRPARKDTAA